MQVTVFNNTTSFFGKKLGDYLDQKGVSYDEKFIDQDDDARKLLSEKSGGFLGVPVLIVDKDGETQKIIGFDKMKIDKVLGLN